MTRPKSLLARFATISMAALLCTACGSSYVPIARAPAGVTASNTNPSTSATGLTSPAGTLSNSTTATTPSGTEPVITERVGAIGYNSTSFTISTATVLKMVFTPGIQDQTVSGTGVSPQYSELGVYISVNGSTQNTGMLSNGLYSGTAQDSPVMDFSNALSGALEAVTITVSQPNNDYFCLNFGMYCAWTQVYQGQPWHGTLKIQTDSTIPLSSSTSFL